MSIIVLMALLAEPAEQCRQTHHTVDGRVIVTQVDAGTAGAQARSSGSGTSSSSSSISAGSSGNGTSSASSTTTVDGVTRTVTVRRDASGCSVTVDDRPLKE